MGDKAMNYTGGNGRGLEAVMGQSVPQSENAASMVNEIGKVAGELLSHAIAIRATLVGQRPPQPNPTGGKVDMNFAVALERIRTILRQTQTELQDISGSLGQL